MSQAVIVVGLQWGDEGKGKVVDLLAKDADFVVRFQGGCNAGHTIVVSDREIVLHLVPSGILNASTVSIIGPGVVVDPFTLLDEIETLKKSGIIVTSENLKVSFNAHVVFSYHREFDSMREEGNRSNTIGTTRRGIGPAYEDMVARRGIRLKELLDGELFRKKLAMSLAERESAVPDVESFIKKYLEAGKRLAPFLADTSVILDKGLKEGKKILFEGAQGTLLDVMHGTYPFVTSSSTVAGSAFVGSGIGPVRDTVIVGIVKAYTTRVGRGPFPTEALDQRGEILRQRGREFGATTGRPRRCGWLDIPALKFARRVNGLTSLAITKLDVLSVLDEVPVCFAYKVSGAFHEELPIEFFNSIPCEPVYRNFRSWDADISGAREIDDLPEEARSYLKFIEDSLETPISIISVGAERDQTIRI